MFEAIKRISIAFIIATINIAIAICVASVVFFELYSQHFMDKNITMMLAILAAVATIVYIKFNHKLEFLIDKGEIENE